MGIVVSKRLQFENILKYEHNKIIMIK